MNNKCLISRIYVSGHGGLKKNKPYPDPYCVAFIHVPQIQMINLIFTMSGQFFSIMKKKLEMSKIKDTSGRNGVL